MKASTVCVNVVSVFMVGMVSRVWRDLRKCVGMRGCSHHSRSYEASSSSSRFVDMHPLSLTRPERLDRILTFGLH